MAPLSLLPLQREVLEKWSRGGSTPYRIVVRSRIVLLASQGCSNRAIARKLRINPITVGRWRSRFLLFGLEGIRREAPRLGSPPRISQDLVRAILRKTYYELPPSTAHWSTRSMARAVGVSHSTVRRVWIAHEVVPPRSRRALMSRDTRFLPKFVDVVGLYVNPPQRAIAISLRPGAGPSSPTARGAKIAAGSGPHRAPPGWIGHLISTLTLLERAQSKGSSPRYVQPEFLSFLQSLRARRRHRERIVLLTENEGVGPNDTLSRWLERHPEFSRQPAKGGAPLQKVVTDWIGNSELQRAWMTTRVGLPDLRNAVEQWMRDSEKDPRPFAWTRESIPSPSSEVH